MSFVTEAAAAAKARTVGTGEPDDSNGSRPVRRGADGKGPGNRYLAGGLPNDKCRVFSSRICHGREAKRLFLRRLARRLWAGQVEAAVTYLEQYRGQAKNAAALEELIA